MKHTAFRSRIAKLEAGKPASALRAIFLEAYDADDAIIGYKGFSDAQIDREQGEDVPTLRTRCRAALTRLAGHSRGGPVFLTAIYPPGALDAEDTPPEFAEQLAALEAAEPEPEQPSALAQLQADKAGIGIIGKTGLYRPGETAFDEWLPGRK